MIANLFKRLTAAREQPLTDPDARLALAALLVRAARSDGDYAPSEITHIERILATRYNLDAASATALRCDAERAEAEAPDTVRFTRAIKEAVPYDQRIGIIEALWQVVLVDGARADAEDALLRIVASLLGVGDIDSAAARQRVARSL